MLLRSWWCAMQSEQGTVSASINTLAPAHGDGCSQVDDIRRESPSDQMPQRITLCILLNREASSAGRVRWLERWEKGSSSVTFPYRFVFFGLDLRYGGHRIDAVEALQQTMATPLREGVFRSIDPLVGRMRRGCAGEASGGCILSGWLHRSRSFGPTNHKPECPPGCRPVAQRPSTLPRKHQGMATDRSPRGMDVRRMDRSGGGCSRKWRSDGGEATCPAPPSPRLRRLDGLLTCYRLPPRHGTCWMLPRTACKSQLQPLEVRSDARTFGG